jgi:hypothetical protein
MNTYSGFQALYMCFFSKDFYRNVVRNWKGIAFLYLFLLIMTSWLLISIKVYFVMNEVINGPVRKIIDRLPVVAIHEGNLKIDQPSPYLLTLNLALDTHVKTPAGELPIAVFDDTTDDVKGEDNVPFLVTKHNLFIQSKDGKAQQFDLKQFGEVKYSKENYLETAEAVKLWVPIAVFLIFGPGSFMICAILVLILGAIGMAVAGGSNIKLTYGETVRIASVAFTPAVILDTIVKLLPVPQMPVWPLIGFGAALGYTIFGVISNRQPIIMGNDSMPGGMPNTGNGSMPGEMPNTGSDSMPGEMPSTGDDSMPGGMPNT